MQFGLFHTVQWPDGTEQQRRYQGALEQIRYVDQAGFDGVWLTEHHFSRHGITPDNLTLLAYIAAEARRLRLGTAVTVLPFDDPLRVAERAALVDQLSGGRLDFGIGRGYQWTEFHGFSLAIEDRGARFDEAIAVIQRAWTDDQPFTHHGIWHYEDAQPQPRPLQSPHPPIWMATTSPEGLTRCARQGWGVLLPQGQSLAKVAEHLAVYREALAELGRAYDPFKVILARALYVGDGEERAWREAEGPYLQFLDAARRIALAPDARAAARNPFDTETLRESVVFGGAESCGRMLERIAALGLQRVMFFVNMGGLAHQQIMGSLERFVRDVMPQAARLEAAEDPPPRQATARRSG